MLLEWRPVLEVLTGEVDADLVDSDLPGSFLRNGISYSEVLESEIAEILKVAGVDLVELRTTVVCKISDRTREVGVRVLLAPALLQEVLRKV